MATSTDSKTDKVIADMLLENTGRVLVDSGDSFGRGYETRRKKGLTTVQAWKNQPWGKIEAMYRDDEETTDDWYPTVSTFHWLSQRVDFNPKLDRMLKTYLKVEGDDSWRGVQGFGEYLAKKRGVTRVRGFDGGPVRAEYTYNYDNVLDVDIQFVLLSVEGGDLDGDHVLVQTHNGCDARWGMSTPRAFDLGQYDGMYAFLTYDQCDISCGNGHSWMQEQSGSYLWDGGTGDDRCELLKRPLKVLNKREYHQCDVACPICGEQLKAYPYGC